MTTLTPIETTVLEDAHPRPVYRVISIVLGIAILGLLLTAATLFFTYKGSSATGDDLAAQGRHRDCVTTIQNARRAVCDDVDIHKAEMVKAGADTQLGIPLTHPMSYYANEDYQLGLALAEARRLQPASTLNRLIAHGGVIDGVRYPACPG